MARSGWGWSRRLSSSRSSPIGKRRGTSGLGSGKVAQAATRFRRLGRAWWNASRAAFRTWSGFLWGCWRSWRRRCSSATRTLPEGARVRGETSLRLTLNVSCTTIRNLFFPAGCRKRLSDVALAVNAIEAKLRDHCDVVIVFSHDMDLLPVPEAIARLARPNQVETASWSSSSFRQRLRPRPPVAHHAITRNIFEGVETPINYARRRAG